MPALAPLLRDNPNVQAHIQSGEIRELPELLLTGNVDLIVTDTPIHRADIEIIELGEEEYVMCQSAKGGGSERYLDHDPSDTTTHRFFAAQSRHVPEYQRGFLAETYALIDGVAAGLGKAVLSRHLIAKDRRIEVIGKYKSMRTKVVLQHHRQPHYTGLHKAAVAALMAKCPGLLETRD